ncbi:MAG: FMN-binding negative transcriptional regulator [Proteobacteria bacterium]|nr:FMN-binding negative transcriptional regulator [Pseudomonadota bacterium]
MYVPQRFAAANPAAALTVIENHGFATLVTPAGDECRITHLPLLLDRETNQLLGHMARANRHHKLQPVAELHHRQIQTRPAPGRRRG